MPFLMVQSRVWIRPVGLMVFALCPGLVGTGADASSSLAAIKTECVLQVGPAEISWYAVDKNVTRLRGGEGGKKTDLRSWFELYLARQVMIAEALVQGYGQRPEVIRVVEAMERHMLAQLDESIAPATEAELHSVYERAPAPPGLDTKPSFEELRPALAQAMIRQRRQALSQTRRDALTSAGLTIIPETVDQLLQRVQSAAPTTATVTSEMIGPLAPEIIATYRLGDDGIKLTVEEWRNRFNELFVRVLPVDAVQLKANIEDLVVKELACRDARRRGLDREPRFVEDRRNFNFYQALDLFEKETLLPRVEITPDETEGYWHEHLSEFVRPLRARGRLLHFRDLTSALRWMHTRDDATASAVEDFEVSRQSPIQGAERLVEPILRARDGEPFGPTPTSSGVVVFMKQTTEMGRLPDSEVANLVRSKLAQVKLQALEIKLAREWAPRYVIEDNLHPEEFGILGPVQKPWAAPK